MKLLTIIIFVSFLSSSILAQNGPVREMPAEFKSDGCTMFPDGNYRECCIEHDKDYYFGGSLRERRASDERLYTCVKAKGGKSNKLTAAIMWMGVRVGAVSFLPTPFRWGFGNKWPRKEPKK